MDGPADMVFVMWIRIRFFSFRTY